MKSLLFLSHRIPYPPNKGDKIRAFHFLKYFSQRYKVYVGTFIDDPEDKKYASEMEQFCEEIFYVTISPKSAKVKSLLGLLENKALSIKYYENKYMENWISEIIQQASIDNIFVFCSSIAPFVMNKKYENKFKVLDMVDVDSLKWKEYAEKSNFLLACLYKRESRLLSKLEVEYTNNFNKTLLVTNEEVEEFKSISGKILNAPVAINNGVDTHYFDPNIPIQDYYDSRYFNIVFTGVMNYKPNEDAVTWFVGEILPELIKIKSNIHFHIVGASPSKVVEKLEQANCVTVVGRVDDIRSYIKYADLVVAPLKTARGIQNKVLEAMAMQKPVIMTSVAAAGINNFPYRKNLIADNKEDYVKKIKFYFNTDVSKQHGGELREYILDNFSWQSTFTKLDDMYLWE